MLSNPVTLSFFSLSWCPRVVVGSRKSRFPGPNHYSWTMLNTFNSASFIPFFFCCKYEARFRLIVSIEWLDKISRMIMFDEVYFSYGVFFLLCRVIVKRLLMLDVHCCCQLKEEKKMGPIKILMNQVVVVLALALNRKFFRRF